jgi:hypothetical protein
MTLVHEDDATELASYPVVPGGTGFSTAARMAAFTRACAWQFGALVLLSQGAAGSGWIGSPIGNRTGTWSTLRSWFAVLLFIWVCTSSALWFNLSMPASSFHGVLIRFCGEDPDPRIHSPASTGSVKRLFTVADAAVLPARAAMTLKLSLSLPYHCARWIVIQLIDKYAGDFLRERSSSSILYCLNTFHELSFAVSLK